MISKTWVTQLYCRRFYTEISAYYVYFLFYWWYDQGEHSCSQVNEKVIALPVHEMQFYMLEIYLKILSVFIYLRFNFRSRHSS